MDMLQVRIDDETKNKANALFNEMGIDLSTAVRIFIKKTLTVLTKHSIIMIGKIEGEVCPSAELLLKRFCLNSE